MRKLTKKEIDDAPNWAVSYCIDIVKTGPIVSYHERHYGFTLPLPSATPKSKEFDITISFTKDEVDSLIDTLDNVEDCGPAYQGWKSDELMGLISKLKKASEGLK